MKLCFSYGRHLARWIALSLVLVVALSAQADVDLYTWTTTPDVLPIVLPVKKGETPPEAARRYLNGLKSPELAEVFDKGIPALPLNGFERLEMRDLAFRALLISNDQRDYQKYERIDAFAKVFAKEPAFMRSYLLPIAADLGLTPEERMDFFAKARKHFPFIVPMGGPDVHPHLYNDKIDGALQLNKRRDKFEFEFLRYMLKDTVQENLDFINEVFSDKPERQVPRDPLWHAGRTNSDPSIFAVCHGEQMTSVVLGYRLKQDIPSQVTDALSHAGGDLHPIQLEGEWITRLVQETLGISSREMIGNSYHHQFVIYREGGPLSRAASTRDGITEMLISHDGRVKAVQFHPEFFYRLKDPIFQKLGEAIMLRAAREAQARFLGAMPTLGREVRSCRQIFR